MPSLNYALPSGLKVSQRPTIGLRRPGFYSSTFDAGRVLTRVWSDRSYATYTLSFEFLDVNDDDIEKMNAFLHHSVLGSAGFWITEPISRLHRDLSCGPSGDGSRTTFPMPVQPADSSELVMEDGVPTTDYTKHDVANLVVDDKYCAPESVGDWVVGGAVASLSTHSKYGPWSVKVTGLGSAVATLTHSVVGTQWPVAAGDDVKVMFHVFDAKSVSREFEIEVNWYDAGESFLSTSTSSAIDSEAEDWQIMSADFTAPASAASAWAQIRERAINTDPWYVDAHGVGPGDFDRIILPSRAPAVIEFDTAPAEGVRVTANATGQRAAWVKMTKSNVAWQEFSPGHVIPVKIECVEDMEA